MLDENVKFFHIYIYIPYSTMSEKWYLYVQALNTGRKSSLWRDILACFASSGNIIFIYRQCMCNITSDILLCQRVQNNNHMIWKEQNQTSFSMIYLYHVRAYTVTVALHESRTSKAMSLSWSVNEYRNNVSS